ncbi:hypothetical protein ABBQ32_010027 [Trebouxia sp. C0010 RCD-2024]
MRSRKQQPWFDSRCRKALTEKEAVYKSPHSTAEDKQVAEKVFRSLTDRVKEAWICQRMRSCVRWLPRVTSGKSSKYHSATPVRFDLSAQLEAFRRLMGAEPPPTPTRPVAPGVSSPDLNNACLDDDITLDELSACIKRLKRGKSPGIDGVTADMIKDGGDPLKEKLLWLFNCILASHFPECLSVGLSLRCTNLETKMI